MVQAVKDYKETRLRRVSLILGLFAVFWRQRLDGGFG